MSDGDSLPRLAGIGRGQLFEIDPAQERAVDSGLIFFEVQNFHLSPFTAARRRCPVQTSGLSAGCFCHLTQQRAKSAYPAAPAASPGSGLPGRPYSRSESSSSTGLDNAFGGAFFVDLDFARIEPVEDHLERRRSLPRRNQEIRRRALRSAGKLTSVTR